MIGIKLKSMITSYSSDYKGSNQNVIILTSDVSLWSYMTVWNPASSSRPFLRCMLWLSSYAWRKFSKWQPYYKTRFLFWEPLLHSCEPPGVATQLHDSGGTAVVLQSNSHQRYWADTLCNRLYVTGCKHNKATAWKPWKVVLKSGPPRCSMQLFSELSCLHSTPVVGGFLTNDYTIFEKNGNRIL